MRRSFFFLFLCWAVFAHAEWDQLFSEDEDSSLFHHVNVVTGNLNLCLQDGLVQGAKSIPLFRTYSSGGALERHWSNGDLDLRDERGLLIQGGWSFFPHVNLLIEIEKKQKNTRAYLQERGGNFVEYGHARRVEDRKSIRMLKPMLKEGQCSGILSARTNPQNNRLLINLREGYAILYLPDGGSRTYVGEELGYFGYGDQRRYYYRLVSEKLPSQHEIHYEYDKKHQIKQVRTTNPRGNKTYASAHFDLFKKSPPFHFRVTTSDAKSFEYQAMVFKERDYLATVKSKDRSDEVSLYAPGRKGTGARVRELTKNGKTELRVSYYLPPDEKTEKKWYEYPKKKGLEADKVSAIEAPAGPSGEMQAIARFWYCKEFTDVRDIDGILTRYFHDDSKVTKIDNYDEKGALYSSTQFLWENEQLRGKVKLNGQGKAVLAKTFRYDEPGNVVEEELLGNLTGDAGDCFALGAGHTLAQAESLSKRFSYDPEFNLPIVEEEEEGPTFRFFYKSGTDLLTLKLTCDRDRILKREIFEYDEDNLLIAEIVDDGGSCNAAELTGVMARQVKRYTLDPNSGLVKTIRECCYDFASGKEVLIRKIELSYSPENLVTQEAVYDAEDTYRYTLVTEYEKGRIIRKTTPLGHENSYSYDSFGNLKKIKEVGSPEKSYTYDALHRPCTCTTHDLAKEKIETSIYDSKGRLLKQVDTKGNVTEQIYDGFGRCLQTIFPKTYDEKQEIHTPCVKFTYDVQGNLATSTTAKGETTETLYNAYRKPIEVRHADGSKLLYRYNKNGTLRRTLYPDGTEIHYTYDIFQRMTSKTVISKYGDKESHETWEYNTFYLLSHTDPRHLTTHYTYDHAGRKILEESEGRKKQFFYDALGFLQRSTEGDVSHVQISDVEGNVVDEWMEETSGRIENRMRFFYDGEGRKEKALRLTSQGEAVDLFAYDVEGRMIKHTNPEGSVTQFLSTEDERNSLDQHVQQKCIIDALGNASIETSDALGRLALLEKKDPQGGVVFREAYFYDRAGNRQERVTSVFDKNRLVKEIRASWEYDLMGRAIVEIEDGKKVTSLTYDEKGRIKTRTLPDGRVMSHSYDSLDRITEMQSSDGTIHLLYFYDAGPEPTEIRDLVQKTKLLRKYNAFGDLLEEINPLGLRYTWEYDTCGRVTKFTLPDSSEITYNYEGSHLSTVARKNAQGHSLYEHLYLDFDENGHVCEEALIYKVTGAKTKRDLLERPVSFYSLPMRLETTYGPTNLVMQTKNSFFGEKSYTYDALGQLEEEGEVRHQFDSVGNPLFCETGSCNQILSYAGCTLDYDACGNPCKRKSQNEEILYTYDALGRLTSITYPQKKQIRFLYDPLSRLLSKTVAFYEEGSWQEEPETLYLYDQEKEIGTIDSSGQIQQLKVLGLGIQGEIGAAVAIELKGTAYAPLHDFQGNILALVSSSCNIVERYEISAFGQEKNKKEPLNPWRYSSKRTEEGLIFFGKRFYDPLLGRFLTPDPAGFVDGPNLYLFVLNSPLNRLDLFGLESNPHLPPTIEAYCPLW